MHRLSPILGRENATVRMVEDAADFGAGISDATVERAYKKHKKLFDRVSPLPPRTRKKSRSASK